MAIPTTGVTGATAYSPTSAWNATITLIGDSESMIGENASGETATLNRSEKQLSQNSKYLYDLLGHSAVTNAIYTKGASTDFNTYLTAYRRQLQRHKLTLTLQENLVLNAAYDEYFDFSNLINFDEIYINLNGKSITCAAGWGAHDYLFDFYRCTCPLITLTNGTITCTAVATTAAMIRVQQCTGYVYISLIDSQLNAATTHYYFISSNGEINNCTLNAGYNGLSATYLSNVYVKQLTTPVANCTHYGLTATTGSTIKKYGAADMPSGTTADENVATGGVIE